MAHIYAMVFLTVLSWILSKAARVLAAVSAALSKLARAMGASGDGCSPGSPMPASLHSAAPQPSPGSSAATETVSPAVAGIVTDQRAQTSKEEFLRGAGSAYGYGGMEQGLRREFSRLGKRVYVDHAGATLYSQAQLRAAHEVSSQPMAAMSPLPGPLPCMLPRNLAACRTSSNAGYGQVKCGLAVHEHMTAEC